MYFSIPNIQTFGKQSCAYWENFLSEDELKYLIDHPFWNNARAGTIANIDTSEINPTVRNCLVSWLMPNQENSSIYKKILSVISDINSKYFRLDIEGCYEPAQLTLYDSSNKSHYDWHMDIYPEDRIIPRKISMSLTLSDNSEYEGGELQIFTSSKPDVLEQKKGRAWFFPSTTLHRVTPITFGCRKSLVLWINGPELK